ncbi:hypothetical protein CKO42_25995 [Lamprobacter modestohalophilus]|uniref:Uncharacterized protein n=1 Tax=Lamprobacter modestohalophilus TaxID=1064514 RepID=A0A9X0WEK0_9GAMM|nr:hypothetical protein [Lamprobacter modestohalophilus]
MMLALLTMTLSAKRQVVLPAELCQLLALAPGAQVEVQGGHGVREAMGRVESRHPAPVDPAYLFPPLSFGGASIAES